MRVVMAPDRFTGTLTATQAAAAMAEGWRAHAPHDEVLTAPLSDGGAGFVDSLGASLHGRLHSVTVTGALGRPAPATVLLVDAADDPSGRATAYLESAQAVGPHLAPAGGTDLAVATSRGVGELLLLGLEAGARRVVVGLGGAGTVDGGAGLLSALGVTCAGTAVLDAGPRGLAGTGVDDLVGLEQARERLAGVELVVASDVDSPLLGRHGAVLGYARHEGAGTAQLPALEATMTGWASAVVRAADRAGAADAGRLVALPGAGAAGGTGFALLALGATRTAGAGAVAEAVRLPELLTGADLVLTGEGSFGWQSLRGRVVAAVSHAAGALAVPVVVVAGQVAVGRRELAVAGVEAAYAVAATPEQVSASVADPARSLAARTARVARTWHR